MSTITINTFLSDTIAREELTAAISRLPSGGDTRTEIIDDETGEVLYTCQRGQVQMSTEVLAAILAKKQGAPSNSGEVDKDDNDNEWNTHPDTVTIAGIIFQVGDRVQAKRTDGEDHCYTKQEKGIVIGIDKEDEAFPIQVRFDGRDARWVMAEDFEIISK